MTIEKTYRFWKLTLALLLLSFFLYKALEDLGEVVGLAETYLGVDGSFFDRLWTTTGSGYTTLNLVFFAVGLATLGFLVAAAALWVVYKVWTVRHPDLGAAAKDELVRSNWLRAFRLSWLIIVALVVVQYAGSYVIDWGANFRSPPGWTGTEQFLLRLIPSRLLLVAVTSLLASFLIFDRDRSRE